MKKLILIALLFTAFQVSTNAQAPATAPAKAAKTESKKDKGPKKSADERAVQYSQELKQKLKLNDDQYSKVLAVNTECIKRKDALKEADDKKAKKDGKKDIKAYRLGEYQKIFTADQLAAYKAMKDDEKDNNDNKHHGKDGKKDDAKN
ncbi:hypothetical protein SAMN04515674_10243 [Pseudarcicella hirudinis]|uniref:LTXXQ motif family protein n=1 Tax=Pseudarcicella hirudinis TaxID=1079859 RepID=A0A1I5NQE2_9BACT|nr:hypothetical protein [Pseudarcicella hirudinis]SFP23451.1 hypothetical protein SAMN04515674_10243 [Pseudarcicella hirudinis]